MHLLDHVEAALNAIAIRPGRAALTALGTVFGVASLVLVLGLTSTARAQISSRFDAFVATEARIESTGAPPSATQFTLPDDSAQRIRVLPGVTGSGLTWPVDTTQTGLRRTWVDLDDATGSAPIYAADPGALDVFDLTVTRGTTFNQWHDERNERVILVSDAVAQGLGVTDVDRQPAVFIGNTPFTIIGIFDAARRHPELLVGSIIPAGTARTLWGTASTGSPQLVVETEPGAAQVVAAQGPLALRPDRPDLLRGVAPPNPRELRNDVDGQVTRLLLALAAISVAVGAFGIANTVLVSVLERIPEIGLRRAVGARRGHIASQFLAESTLLGTLGGVLGASIGLIGVALVSIVNGWSATVDPQTVALAPLLGTITGFVAGLVPAWRAARIQPADALRR